jgi:SAM-dependent methyltransferase
VTAVPAVDLPIGVVFAEALRGRDCHLIGLDDGPVPLPVDRWRCDADASDGALLEHCRGHTLDVGCGPGRMSEHLMSLGHGVLGIDLVPEAVRQARARGVATLLRDVFGPLPGEGRWDTVLLADGNIGIGGDPVALLRRAVELLAPTGRVVADLAPPGTGIRARELTIRSVAGTTRPFSWASVAADEVGRLGAIVGLPHTAAYDVGDRWVGVLERR